MNADRSLLRIIGSFDLDDIRDVHRIKRGVYKLTSRKGELLCLKRMRYTEERVRWMDKTLGALRRAGFSQLAWRDSNERHGKRLFVKASRKDHPYILTPWLAGRLPSARSTTDMREVAMTLARFHETSHSIDIPHDGMDNWLGRWPERLQERTDLLERHITSAKQRAKRRERLSKMDELLSTHGDQLLQRAQNALRVLKKSDYRDLCKRAARQMTVVHGDSGPKNFVLTELGPYLIDFETLRVDLRVYDVYRLLRLASKDNDWDFTVAQAMLEGYRSVSPLERTEYDLLRVWLYFPQKAFRTLRKFERAREGEERDKLTRKLQNM
ncbi:MAG: phosphotransferase, partial [Tumebacillaceae bacterium]